MLTIIQLNGYNYQEHPYAQHNTSLKSFNGWLLTDGSLKLNPSGYGGHTENARALGYLDCEALSRTGAIKLQEGTFLSYGDTVTQAQYNAMDRYFQKKQFADEHIADMLKVFKVND